MLIGIKNVNAWANKLRYFFLMLLFVYSGPLRASFSQKQHDLISSLTLEAKTKKLAQKRKWQKILFIPDRWSASKKSIVDHPEFFLSSKSGFSPEKELVASLSSFVTHKSLTIQKIKRKAFCFFPARLKFLDEHLNLIEKAQINLKECKGLSDYLKLADYQKVSLVFSSYYLNNPSSMFGHTLLRLHRKYDYDYLTRSGQLDDALNYSAMTPPSSFALTYTLKGLLGGFPGRFMLVPYYTKIQEYNNAESRDLWEYELKLDQSHIDWLVLILWEQGFFYSNYFYLDENCSYALLLLLEASRPESYLTKQLPLYTIPIDSVRAVTNQDLVSKITYKPSNFTKLQTNIKNLSEDEIKILQKSIAEKKIPSSLLSEVKPEKSQAKIYDALVEYIDYKEKLTGSKKSEQFHDFRQQLLRRRSKLPTRKKVQPTVEVEKTNPSLGHKSALVSLGAGHQDDKGVYVSGTWRPAFHDLSARGRGYSNDMEIRFLETKIKYYLTHQKITLQKLNLIKIMSLPPNLNLIKPLSWSVDLSYEQIKYCLAFSDSCSKIFIDAKFGKNIRFFSDRIRLFLLLGPELNYQMATEKQMGFQLNIASGIILSPHRKIKLFFEGHVSQEFYSQYAKKEYLASTVSYYFNDDWETRIFANLDYNRFETSLSLLHYF